MADDSEITTLTRYIPVDFFLGMIESDIKNFIHTYGHKKCGLRQEELCDKIKEIIPEKKKIIFAHMNARAQQKWSTEWNKQRSKYFSKLYDEEGFINMCFPNKYPKKNQSLNQLLSKYIQFCKEKDVRRAAVVENPVFSECVQYNSWIESQRKSFTNEYLHNVRNFTSKTVDKYFSTKDHPGGHDPRPTYLNSKLNCIQYKPPPISHPQIPVAKAPTNELQPLTESNIISGSQGKDGGSVTDKDSESSKTKPEENKTQRPKSHTPDSQIPAPSKTEGDGTHTGQATHVTPKAPGSLVNRDGEKKESIPIQGEPSTDRLQNARDEDPPQTKSPPLSPKDTSPISATQSVPAPTTTSLFSTPTTIINTTSSQTPVTSPNLTITSDSSANSSSPLPSNLLPPTADTNGQDRAPQSSTTLGTLESTHPNKSVLSTEPTDSSLPQHQDPVLTVSPDVTTANEPGTPPSSSASAITTTVTTTTTSLVAVTSPIMSITQGSILFTQQDPSASSSQEAPHKPVSSGPKTTVHNKEPQQTVIHQTTSIGGRDNGGISVPTQTDGNKIITLSENTPQQSKDLSLLSNTSLPEGAQPDESTYESPNITVHEWEDPNLVGQTVENDLYTKLLKINRYKQEMQKRKKKNKKTLIEVHMEVLEQYKNDEWELHKGDFLEICLRGFMNEENNTYSKLPNSELIVNDIKSEKTIEDIQKQEILWNNWIENHRNILEQWKKEEWFHILKNKWRNEEQKCKEKNDKLQENILNEQDTYSIVSQKDIWKQWISKQATLVKMFNQEDWFKELVDEQNKEKNNYHINEYNNISVTSKIGLKNKKTNHEEGRSKNIIQKLMVQIHMMVLEECIKEDIIRNKESSIDNFIQDIHKQNNYDEKRNIPLYNKDD
ncbi:SICA C-terminal inner membrane domain containing protein, putative [Plasmodium ovale]|uniref:SICA C-terminal inner membrane domain containing protein, putative n=1 Tax=Plasmodium ovale TaxID=36330 RepID=A0A1C3KLF0_PLAOA|nr:SICA C-terminal inner membrane domain containing protein, putative [Plasmodium ovale]